MIVAAISTPQRAYTHHVCMELERYLDNIAAAATQTAANGGPLAELADILTISVDTVASQQQ